MPTAEVVEVERGRKSHADDENVEAPQFVHDFPDRASWFKGVDFYSSFTILYTVSKVPD
jgi:hypothetical protein